MISSEIFTCTNTLITFCVSLCSYFMVLYLWNRRHLYHYAAKIPGPLSPPIIGSAYIFLCGTQRILENVKHYIGRYKPTFKFWLGPKLFVVVTQPRDIEIVLNQCPEKAHFYQYFTDVFGNGLLTSPANQWKRHRKVIGPTFNQQILNSFVGTFEDYSNILVEKLKGMVGKGCVDLFPIFSQSTLDIVCDTTMGIQVKAMKEGSQYILWTSRASELGVMRSFNVFLHPNFIWKLSWYCREMQSISQKMQKYVKQILETKRREKVQSSVNNKDVPRKKIFLDYLLSLTDQGGKWSDEETIEETRTVIIAGSYATAVTLCYVLMMLAMHQDMQNKVYDEIMSILEDDRSPTPADLQEMTYLERFIKESLRLFPVASVIARFVTDDVALENYVLPRGTTVLVPILHLHRDPDFWPDPLSFNPDRFLTEEVSKRHPYQYLPFSGGPRNCIGFRYAMLAMKTVLSMLLRHYRVVATTHTSVSDIKLKLDVSTKCVGGQKIQLEFRSG